MTDAAPPPKPHGPLRAVLRPVLEGALVVLPLGGVALLVLGIVHRLQAAADPLAGQFLHPLVGALVLLLLLCGLVGVLLRSRAGRQVGRALEGSVLHRIPGYRLARALVADEIPGGGAGKRRPHPALASIEEGLCPALVMDAFADGRLVVFVPGTPAPMAGALYVFTPDKVTLLDVPLLPFLKTVSSWGIGLPELIEAAERSPPARSAA